jgi:hypothetical protein
MELLLAIVLSNKEVIPAGSTVQAHVQGAKVILPVDEDFTVSQVLEYMNKISPSLDAQYIVKLKDGGYAVVVKD